MLNYKSYRAFKTWQLFFYGNSGRGIVYSVITYKFNIRIDIKRSNDPRIGLNTAVRYEKEISPIGFYHSYHATFSM